MHDGNSPRRLDRLFEQARTGDRDAFAEWMGMVEIPIRRSLRRFARAADVEVVVQEMFLRMWLAAADSQRVFEGEHASLRFAFRVARLVALEEIRHNRLQSLVSLEELEDSPEGAVEPLPPPDPALGRAIRECMERLPAKPRIALNARIVEGHRPDREVAQGIQMKVNTFFQNIVRARHLLSECLERRGVRLGEILS